MIKLSLTKLKAFVFISNTHISFVKEHSEELAPIRNTIRIGFGPDDLTTPKLNLTATVCDTRIARGHGQA